MATKTHAKAYFTYFWNFLHMCSRGNKGLKLIIFIKMTVTLLMIDTICIIPRELSKVVKPSVEKNYSRLINFASILVISEHCSTCIGRNSFAIVSNQNMKLNFPHVIEKCSYFVDIRITFFSLRFVLKIQNIKIVYSRLFNA